MRRALDGVRVLEICQGAAGPYVTTLLGFLGAEVIKLEAPSGDLGRTALTTHFEGISYSFAGTNLNKKGITLDLKSAKGKEMIKEIIPKMDIFVENLTPGAIEGLGFGYEAVSKISPKVIYCSVCGFGRGSKYERLPAMDLTMQAMGGAMPSCGTKETPPLKAGVMYLDWITPTHAATAVLAALYDRERTGKGQYVQVAMRDVAAFMNNDLYNVYFESGRVPKGVGNRVVGLYPVNTFKTSDGYVAIGVINDEMMARLFEIIGRKDLVGDEKFKKRPERWRNRDELDAVIEEWTQTKTKKEAFEIVSGQHIPSAPVFDAEDILNDDDLANRGQIVEMDQPGIGKKKFAVSPMLMSGSAPIHNPAPLLGEHNAEVYKEFLGYGPQDIAKLKEDGVI